MAEQKIRFDDINVRIGISKCYTRSVFQGASLATSTSS